MSGEACCGRCAPLESSLSATDPLSILRRLPEALFSQEAPIAFNAGATFDEVYLDQSVFGPVEGRTETLQYALARLVAQERDYFLRDYRRALADQLGLGRMEAVDGETVGECPRASGDDLDELARQFGVSRPRGFGDCCLWRLVVLLTFRPGPTVWLLRELAQLYTGQRPIAAESPALIGLVWPVGGGESFRDAFATVDDGRGWFNDVDSYNADPPAFRVDDPAGWAQGPGALHGYWFDGGAWDPNVLGGDDPLAFFAEGSPALGAGMTLEQAINQVKPAGVAVQFTGMPRPGSGGCYGGTQRTQELEASVWA